jgi:hypothetical protein
MSILRSTLLQLTGVLALATLPPAMSATNTVVPLDVGTIDQLLSKPQSYDKHIVHLDACLFVTRHGMDLYNCNYRSGGDVQLVSFEPLHKTHDQAYQRLINAGFANRYKDIVLVTLTGEFQFSPSKKPNYVLRISSATIFRTIRDPEL